MVEATSAEEIIKVMVTTTAATLLLALLILIYAFSTLLIVDCSLLRVWENFVSICNFGKFRLSGLSLITILVGVIADSQLFESLLNLLLINVSLKSHNAVVVVCWVWGLLGFSSETTSAAKVASTSKLLEEFFISAHTATKVMLLPLSSPIALHRLDQSKASLEAY